MHVKGLEPSRDIPLEPKPSASTNSAIRAKWGKSSPEQARHLFVLVVNRNQPHGRGQMDPPLTFYQKQETGREFTPSAPGFFKSLHDFGIEGDPSPTRALLKSFRDWYILPDYLVVVYMGDVGIEPTLAEL